MLPNNSTPRRQKIIAIDGPVASGKGTIAPLLAEKLQGFYLPTGVMYRCVTLFNQRRNQVESRQAIIDSLSHLTIRIRDSRVLLNEEDVTEEIKQNDISLKTPYVSGIAEVRQALIEEQRAIGNEYTDKGQVVVAEGRDIGTIVFPHAALKIYLTASQAIRARRRLEQLHAHGETQATYASVFEDTKERDTYDQEKSKTLVTDPEKAGYTIVDNSELSQEETLERIIRIIDKTNRL